MSLSAPIEGELCCEKAPEGVSGVAGTGLERELAGDSVVVEDGVDDVDDGVLENKPLEGGEAVCTMEGCSPGAKKSAESPFQPLSKLRGNSSSGEMGDMPT